MTELDERLRPYLMPEATRVEPALGATVDGSAHLSDEEILQRARSAADGKGQHFCELYDAGNKGVYASASEADLALCSVLMFWASNDRGVVDRLFRMSALHRRKWDERNDYRERTLDAAAHNTGGYRPRVSVVTPTPSSASLPPALVAERSSSNLNNPPLEVKFMEASGDELANSTTTIDDLPFLPLLSARGWLVEGWSHLLAGYPRVGKTELMVAILREWLDRGTRVLYITEEPRMMWEVRLRSLPPAEWSELTVFFGLGIDVDAMRQRAREGQEHVVIVDAVRNLLQLRDEKDNSEIARSCNPWVADARLSGKTLVMLHHQRKGGGEHGEGIAGGHALLGAFDIAIEVLRDRNQASNRRLLRSYARLIPARESVYEKSDAGPFRLLGDPRAVSLAAVEERLLGMLLDRPGDLLTTRELHDALEEPRPSKEQCRSALDALAKCGKIVRDPPISSGAVQGKTPRWTVPKADERLEGTEVPTNVA